MKKITLVVELEYDDDIMHGNDEAAIRWFKESILLQLYEPESEGLILHSNSIGDEIGTIKVLRIEND